MLHLIMTQRSAVLNLQIVNALWLLLNVNFCKVAFLGCLSLFLIVLRPSKIKNLCKGKCFIVFKMMMIDFRWVSYTSYNSSIRKKEKESFQNEVIWVRLIPLAIMLENKLDDSLFWTSLLRVLQYSPLLVKNLLYWNKMLKWSLTLHGVNYITNNRSKCLKCDEK